MVPIRMSAPENPLITAGTTSAAPFRQLFSPRTCRSSGLAFLLVCALWADAVWAFFGGRDHRLVALQVTRANAAACGPRCAMLGARDVAYLTAPLFPLFGVLLFVLAAGRAGPASGNGARRACSCCADPLAAVPDGGADDHDFPHRACLWLAADVADDHAEGTDSFDALCRSYSYVYQRPLHYLWYATLAGVLGTVAGILR